MPDMRYQVKKPRIRYYVFSAIAVTAISFLLLNIAFIFDYIYSSIVTLVLHPLLQLSSLLNNGMFNALLHLSFVLIVVTITQTILHSDWPLILKASYFSVPVAVMYVTIGMFMWQLPVVVYAASGLFAVFVILVLYLSEKPWQYYFSFSLISLVLLLSGILGMEI